MKNKTRNLHLFNCMIMMNFVLIVLMIVLTNGVCQIYAATDITYNYYVAANWPRYCSGGDGENNFWCPTIGNVLNHLNENVKTISKPTIVTVLIGFYSSKECTIPSSNSNPNVSFRIIVTNGLVASNELGSITCPKETSIVADDPSIISFEARNLKFELVGFQFTHSPNVTIENCVFGRSSPMSIGSTPEQTSTSTRTVSTLVMRKVVYLAHNKMSISNYQSVYVSEMSFVKVYAFSESLIANSGSLIIENSEIMLLLYVEKVDSVVLRNVVTLNSNYVAVTQSSYILFDNVNCQRMLSNSIPYLISHSVFASVRNSVITIDKSPFLSSSSLLKMEIENVTIHDSHTLGSVITVSSVKDVTVKYCSFTNIRATALQFLEVFHLEIVYSNFTNVTSNTFKGAIHSADTARWSTKEFSGRKTQLIRNSRFENCRGGALYFLSESRTSISNCLFYHNTAGWGGAIYYHQHAALFNYIYVSQSKFISNGDSRSLGGVLYLSGQAMFEDCSFERNRAEMGGVVFLGGEGEIPSTITFYNENKFFNNSAFSGPIAYSETNDPNSVVRPGLNYTTFDVGDMSSPCFSFHFEIYDESTRESVIVNDKLSPYLGQTLIVKITPFDIFGKEIKQTKDHVSLTVNSQFVVRNGATSYKTLEFAMYADENVISFPFNMTINFEKAQSTIELIVAPCPYFYVFGDTGCVSVWYWIPIASVLSSIIVGVSVIAVIGVVFARYKSQLLKKRKRADQELEQVLLDKRIIFESDEPQPKNSNSLIISTNDITITKKIGEGGQGTVYQAKWSNKDVALKSIKKEGLNDDDEFEKEVTLLMGLSHPNIVTFFGLCVPNPNQKYMVIEFMRGGSLDKLISECKVGKKILTLKEKVNILVEVGRGMHYLHTLKPNIIAHRDLKPQNILLDEHRSVKICDFGLSRVVGNSSWQTSMTLNIGTLLYCPPENFVHNNNRSNYEMMGNMSGFSYESYEETSSVQFEGSIGSSVLREDRIRTASKFDVYSFGIIMWSLFFEEDPYTVYNHKKMNYFTESEEGSAFNVITQIVKGKRPTIPFSNDAELEMWSKEFVIPNPTKRELDECSIQGIIVYMNLMQKCWHQIPHERPSFDSILCDLYEIMHLCGGSMLV